MYEVDWRTDSLLPPTVSSTPPKNDGQVPSGSRHKIIIKTTFREDGLPQAVDILNEENPSHRSYNLARHRVRRYFGGRDRRYRDYSES